MYNYFKLMHEVTDVVEVISKHKKWRKPSVTGV
jgi:hypothetical protein